MNPIAEEIKSYFGSSKDKKDFIAHVGTPQQFDFDPHGSGRYRQGSGEEPYQHSIDFLGRVEKLKAKGWKETPENIKKEFGLTTKEYRMEKSICNDERRMALVSRAKSLRDGGHSIMDISRRMKVPEATIRSWFDTEVESRIRQTRDLADALKKAVNEKPYGMVDIGVNQDIDLNVSREKLDTALYLLQKEGYNVFSGRIPQATNPNQMTTQRVLTTPDHKESDIYDYEKVSTLKDYISRDNGQTIEKKFNYPASMDSSRIKVMLKNEVGKDGFTGEDKDGLIEIRRGVPDLSLGKSLYSQVRILVDKNRYLKGMAVYSDDIPDGYDLVFNSNKLTREDAFKKIKNDPDNPFGSTIKDADQGGQYWYTDSNGKKKLGLINKRADEGDWSEWADSLPSQFLSKQSKQLAKQQLKLAKEYKEAEYEDIVKLNNPVIKRYYLDKFAKSCDKAAEDLKAAALPGQKYHVIIPNNTLKNNEIYAPGYKDGTKLALVRYPHGGIFEIPIVTVNNKNSLGQKLIGKLSMDAVCVNHEVAKQLSGADFDGDTVMCIPTHDSKGRVKISSSNPLPELKSFDPDIYKWDKKVKNKDGEYTYYREGKKFKPMSENSKQTQMGIVSNLITDMTLLGAQPHEIARAVKHSMVVIDAVKQYDYRQSYIDNNIKELVNRYQIKVDKNGNIKYGGASTIVSRAGGEIEVPKTRGEAKVNIKGKSWYDPNRPEGALIYKKAKDSELYYADKKINKKTGLTEIKTIDGKKISYDANNKKEYEKYAPVMKKDKKTGDIIFTNKDGSLIYKSRMRTMPSTQMAQTDDARTLVSKKQHPMELIYADYANNMKALANKARIESINTKNLQYNSQAAKTYSKEVSALNAKLNEALKNAIKERHVQRLTASEVQKRLKQDPSMTADDIKKTSQRLQTKYREELGSIPRRQRNMGITDKEWEAIQAGAISNNKLKKILDNSDPEILRQRSMPKDKPVISTAMINRMKTMRDSNFTLEEIATKLGVSKSTVSNYLKD